MIKFGLIGLKWGASYIKNVNLIPDQAQIAYLCARNQSSYDNLKVKPNNEHKFTTDTMELINSDVDIVIIASGPVSQKLLAIYALDCNRNLILEKPLALNYQDALEIEKAANRTKKNIIVNYTDLYQPQYQKCKEFAKFSSASKFIKIEHGGNGPERLDYTALYDWISHGLALALDYNNNVLPLEYYILSAAPKDAKRNNYSINLRFNNDNVWICGGNAYYDQKVRRFCVYDELHGVCTFEQFKTEHREQVYDSNPMLIMLENYIDKLNKKEYYSNLSLAINVTYLLEKLEEKLK